MSFDTSIFNTKNNVINSANIKAQFRKGFLEYCLLLILSANRYYPSDIIAKLKEADMIVVEGTLYTLLNRLRKEGKLNYEWEESPKGPPRKYYFITEFGLEVLKVMHEAWMEMSNSIEYFSREYGCKNSETEKTEGQNEENY